MRDRLGSLEDFDRHQPALDGHDGPAASRIEKHLPVLG